MRVLWFTNIPMPAVDRRFGRDTKGSGYWMTTLLRELWKKDGIQLGVATACPGLPDDLFQVDDMEHYIIGQPRRISPGKHRSVDIQKAASIVDAYRPDLVHIHGTERFYGLLGARNIVQPPIIISLQGLISKIRSKMLGSLSLLDCVRAHSLVEILRWRGVVPSYMRFKSLARREIEIIQESKYIAGRTDWDKAQVRAINPNVRYFHVGEMLREPFFECEWSIDKCRRHSIIFTNATSPLRGVETLLEAVSLLVRDFPDLKLYIAGRISDKTGYGRFQRKRVQQMGLKAHMQYLGYLDTDDLIAALCNAHVFVVPSLIENSPNSLCEAQLLGMPCVASYAGGIPSLVQERESGLLFPPGDAAVLAERIRQLFLDGGLSKRLGRNARAIAGKRHSKEVVLNQLMTAYRDILKQ